MNKRKWKMKREDITALIPDISKEHLDKIMEINGNDVNAAKRTAADSTARIAALEAEKKTLEGQLSGLDQLKAESAELAALKAAVAVRDLREKVAAEKKIPVSLLTGETEEDCNTQADAILAFAGTTSNGRVPDGGNLNPAGKADTAALFSQWINGAQN